MARMADAAELTQLASAAAVLGHAKHLINRTGIVSADEYRWTARRLTECLSDVIRIAESRGMR